MARATCIYIVTGMYHQVLATFTVKYECFQWCEASGYGPGDVQVKRQRDGLGELGCKEMVDVPWPTNS